MKRENRKVNHNLEEVTGNREELADYVNQELYVEGFVTNTFGYMDTKRLVTEVKIDNFFIKHVWFKNENIGNLKHGYQKLKVKVTKYKDQVTQEIKYGLKYIDKKGKKYQSTFLVKPKWMKDD